MFTEKLFKVFIKVFRLSLLRLSSSEVTFVLRLMKFCVVKAAYIQVILLNFVQKKRQALPLYVISYSYRQKTIEKVSVFYLSRSFIYFFHPCLFYNFPIICVLLLVFACVSLNESLVQTFVLNEWGNEIVKILLTFCMSDIQTMI